MNEIKLSGKVLKKELLKNSFFIRIVLAVPTKIKITENDKSETTCSNISFLLYEPNILNINKIKKGSYMEIVGQLLTNCDKEEAIADELAIMPKNIKKGLS